MTRETQEVRSDKREKKREKNREKREKKLTNVSIALTHTYVQ